MVKKIIALFMAAALLCGFTGCTGGTRQAGPVTLDLGNSNYMDFSVVGGMVEIVCRYSMKNDSDDTQLVSITIDTAADMTGGLLLEDSLNATVAVQPGSGLYRVIFIGTFGGTERKQTRLLPEIREFLVLS